MIPLVTDTWDSQEQDAIVDVLRSKRLSMGPRVAEFERAFAQRFGTKNAVCVNSGSSANLLGLAALHFARGWRRGDKVLVPTIGWSTTYSPLYYLGLEPVFIDVSLSDLNIDTGLISGVDLDRVVAVLAVNLLGVPAKLNWLRDFCESKNLDLFEDNCEAMGATLQGKPTGTFGVLSSFSFFFSHHITTVEGGMVLTDSDELADICRCIRAHGWTRELNQDSALYSKEIDEFKRKFWFVLPGFNIRPTEFVGAVGLVQLKKFDSFLSARRINDTYFRKLCDSKSYVHTTFYNEGGGAFSLPLIFGSRSDRDAVVECFKLHNIECRPIASGDMLQQPMLKYFDNYSIITVDNVSEMVDSQGLMIGNHPIDMKNSLDMLFEVLDHHFSEA
jgi:CDP-6-deoxy-D-xylo-4-hexulose-3-dehydrase